MCMSVLPDRGSWFSPSRNGHKYWLLMGALDGYHSGGADDAGFERLVPSHSPIEFIAHFGDESGSWHS